jgi:uncharacterized membrane protein (UPF0127 family)
MKYYIAFTLIIVITISCTESKKPKPNPNLPPKYAIKAEPKFHHQGNLHFLSRKGSEVASIKIEVADDNAKREQGMMYRKSMAANEGMLFIFPDERRRSFWMKNCHVSLDIIFVNSNKEIVHIAENCEPYSLKSIPSFEYAQYVVEVKAGYCHEFGLHVGNAIDYKLFNELNF